MSKEMINCTYSPYRNKEKRFIRHAHSPKPVRYFTNDPQARTLDTKYTFQTMALLYGCDYVSHSRSYVTLVTNAKDVDAYMNIIVFFFASENVDI